MAIDQERSEFSPGPDVLVWGLSKSGNAQFGDCGLPTRGHFLVGVTKNMPGMLDRAGEDTCPWLKMLQAAL
jgi:hypothetical protein